MSNEEKIIAIWRALEYNTPEEIRQAAKAIGLENYDTARPLEWSKAARDLGIDPAGFIWDYTRNTVGGEPVNLWGKLWDALRGLMNEPGPRLALYQHVGAKLAQYKRIEKKAGKRKRDLFLIDFCGDHAQYFTGRGSKDGYFGPFIGAGEDEAEAYQNATDHAAQTDTPDKYVDALPARRGSKRRGIAHYFGRETAAQHRKYEDSDLYIYCIIYIKK